MAIKVAPTVAQQIFTVGSGVAGGLAGFVLANRLAQSDEDVNLSAVGLATALSFAATFGAAFLITSTVKSSEQA